MPAEIALAGLELETLERVAFGSSKQRARMPAALLSHSARAAAENEREPGRRHSLPAPDRTGRWHWDGLERLRGY